MIRLGSGSKGGGGTKETVHGLGGAVRGEYWATDTEEREWSGTSLTMSKRNKKRLSKPPSFRATS